MKISPRLVPLLLNYWCLVSCALITSSFISFIAQQLQKYMYLHVATMKQHIQANPFGGLLTPTHPYLSLRHQTSHRLPGTEPPRALASSKTSYMSFSSAESRAFISQPSPLLTEVDPGPISSGDAQARPELKVIIQPPLGLSRQIQFTRLHPTTTY
ncbi:hypothetical protein DFP73DRAFT_351513 [Morchella snyderi]|nr:hypothetical protein DFP73DRAFT_351513 [Morchella snyderi]